MRILGERLAACVLGALMLASLGCAPLPVHQGTDTTPKGRVQLGGSVGGVLYRDVEQDTRTPTGDVQLGARVGLGEDLDAGGKIFLFGLDVGLKWRMLRGAVPVAIAPSIGGSRYPTTAGATDSAYAWGRLPVIVGRRLSDSVAIHGGPTSLYGLFAPRGGGTAHGLSIGGFVNLEIKLAKRARMLPELAIYRSVAGDVPVNGWSMYLGPAFALDLGRDEPTAPVSARR